MSTRLRRMVGPASGSGGLRLLVAGQAVSALGDWIATFAFMALALRLTGSPTAVGAVLALRLLPAVLGGPLAARAASRWDRRTVMLAMDGLRAVLAASVPLVRSIWWLYALAFALEVASIVFVTARDAAIPNVVAPSSRAVANGLVLASSYGTIPLGAACFSIAGASAGGLGRPFALVFGIDALTYLVSMACVARLRALGARDAGALPGEAAPGAQVGSSGPEPSGRLRLRDARALPLVRAIAPAVFAVAVGLGSLFSLGIVFVRRVLHASEGEFGVLVALFGLGALLGLLALHAGRAAQPLARTRAGVCALGLVVATFGLVPSLPLAFAGAVAFGAAAAFTLASGMETLQSDLEGARRDLGFATFHTVVRLGLGVAALGAGLVAELVGTTTLPGFGAVEASRLVLFVSGVFVAVVGARVGSSRRFVSVARAEPAPDRSPA